MYGVIFIVGLYFLIIELTRRAFHHFMMKCSDVRRALFFRRLLLLTRWSISFVYWGIVLFFNIDYIFNDYGDYSFDIKLKGTAIAIIMAIQYWKQNKWENPQGKIGHIFRISYASKEKVLKSKDGFILFLRGFEHDDYTDTFYLKDKEHFTHFSEYHFVKAMDRYKCTYAVGMTKELEQPSGAKRLYLNDSTWREDVKELMEKSIAIIILMNDKESCVWEIEQSATMLEKTYFFIDTFEKYCNIKEKTQAILNFPELNESALPLLIHFKGNGIIKMPYHNNVYDYRSISNRIAMQAYHLSDFDETEEDEQTVCRESVGKRHITLWELFVFLKWNHRNLCVFLPIVNLIVTAILIQLIESTYSEVYFSIIFFLLTIGELFAFWLYYNSAINSNTK